LNQEPIDSGTGRQLRQERDMHPEELEQQNKELPTAQETLTISRKQYFELNDLVKKRTEQLEEINTALNVVLKKREQDARKMERQISANFQTIVHPFLDRLRNTPLNSDQHQLLDLIDTNLKKILSPFSKKLSDPLIRLTPNEIRIASMIRQGLTNKEIARILNSSVRTIDTHRANMRKKLGLKNKKINLKSYLSHL
jgi:DNA-binding CsgD family transcriptional regulator